MNGFLFITMAVEVSTDTFYLLSGKYFSLPYPIALYIPLFQREFDIRKLF